MQLETITITLPLGVSLTSPIAELERAIYPQHAGLAALIARTVDAENEVTEREQQQEREADEAIRVRDAMASALETLCDAIDDCDAAIAKLCDAEVIARPPGFDDALDIALGALLKASETARCEL